MECRMRGIFALICHVVAFSAIHGFVPGADGPVSSQEALEGGNTTMLCDSSTTSSDQLMLLVWYKNNAPIYSFDARIPAEWSSATFNTSSRLQVDLTHQPTTLTISSLREDDQGLYHCRVDFLISPTRNVGVNLTVVVLPITPFFFDEMNTKVEDKIGPYHEGATLVLTCFVVGGRPPPHIAWYSGETLVDASDGVSDTPGMKENELYLPLSRDNAASLSCRATNTKLAEPIVKSLKVELYLPPYNVSIHWVRGTVDGSLEAGRVAGARCLATGSHPPPELAWWLDHHHLTSRSNQSWDEETQTASSYLEFVPSVGDNGATLACVATNPVMAPNRRSKADVMMLNVTYSPIVEVSRIGAGGVAEVVELDPLQLQCEVRANPPVTNFSWFFNDVKITPGDIWGVETSSSVLLVEEASRRHAGSYSCAASNSVGETVAEALTITVYYPPECSGAGISLKKETLLCHVTALPTPDTYFWHIEPHDLDIQDLTTGSGILPLSQITGPLSAPLKASCEAGNGVSSQEVKCEKVISLEHLRPKMPHQCDIEYEKEFGEFQIRCVPVENATYYSVSVWRLSSTNTSLVREPRGSMQVASQARAARGDIPWMLRGNLGPLSEGDEAGASACNRYGCSRALVLRPADTLLLAANPPWWHSLLEKDVGISVGAVVLVVVFVLSSLLAARLARRGRKRAPVIQVLQLDDAREYLDAIGEQKFRHSCSIRSCSSVYSDHSNEWVPPVDRIRKPRALLEAPPPDVTLTLHRESAV